MPSMAEVAYLRLTLLDDGNMDIEGNIGDVRLALSMLDSAREAVKRRLGRPSILEPHGAGLVVPHADVQARPNEAIYPLIAVGDRR